MAPRLGAGSPGGIWHWGAEKNQFVWPDAGWEVPPRNHLWLGGSWLRRDQEWMTVESHWQPYIPLEPPPAPKVEGRPAATSAEHQWRPGEWIWEPPNSTQTGSPSNFLWREGNDVCVLPCSHVALRRLRVRLPATSTP